MYKIKAIDFAIFDCDGVVLDSNAVKSDAFRIVAERYASAEQAQRFVEYHQENGGISRFAKFQFFFRNIVGVGDSEEEGLVGAAALAFGNEVYDRLLNVAFIPGVERLLQKLFVRHVPCFVNSGGFQDELRRVFAERGLARYFWDILGAPATKVENVTKLLQLVPANASGIFFGDSLSDYKAAVHFGIPFAFLSCVSEWEGGSDFCRERAIPVLRDFNEIEFDDA